MSAAKSETNKQLLPCRELNTSALSLAGAYRPGDEKFDSHHGSTSSLKYAGLHDDSSEDERRDDGAMSKVSTLPLNGQRMSEPDGKVFERQVRRDSFKTP